MRRIKKSMFSLTLLPLAVFLSSCDYSGGDSFSSRVPENEKYVEVNVNGSYSGDLSGGLAVGVTSGDRITSITLNVQRSQDDETTSSVTATDNLGNQYTGNVGFPISEVSEGNPQVVPGTLLTSLQIGFSGYHSSARTAVEFAGAVNVVADQVGQPGDSISTTLILQGTWVEGSGANDEVQARKSGPQVNLNDFF